MTWTTTVFAADEASRHTLDQILECQDLEQFPSIFLKKRQGKEYPGYFEVPIQLNYKQERL